MKMKTVKFFLSLLCCVALLTSCTRTKNEYFEDGSLQSSIQYRFGKETGVSKYYFINAPHPLKIMMEMKDGKRNGDFVKYFINGKVETRCTYKDDLEEGLEENFSIYGYKVSDIHFLHGKKHGPIVYYHANGEIKEQGSFAEDMFDGHWTYYDERGVMVGEGDFDKGTGVQKGFNANGNITRIIHYVDNVKNGEDIELSNDGDTLKVTVFENDRIVSVNGESVDNE